MATYYKHKYGGIYRIITEGIHVDTKLIMVVYEHIYPFEQQTYIRNKTEFEMNFSIIEYSQICTELSKDKIAFQIEITNNKTNSKNNNTTNPHPLPENL